MQVGRAANGEMVVYTIKEKVKTETKKYAWFSLFVQIHQAQDVLFICGPQSTLQAFLGSYPSYRETERVFCSDRQGW